MSLLEHLEKYQPVTLAPTTQCAAVMIILLADNSDAFDIVITERSPHLATYAGHYSFPGGMSDTHDADLYATAVREVQEELSLLPESYRQLAQLDDFNDRYGHLVRPFVTLMQKEDFSRMHQASPAEINSIYYFSTEKLAALQDNPALHAITRRRPSYSFTDGNVFIWGLTAAILVHLSNILFDEHKSLGKQINL